jgi:hypothetical protein
MESELPSRGRDHECFWSASGTRVGPEKASRALVRGRERPKLRETFQTNKKTPGYRMVVCWLRQRSQWAQELHAPHQLSYRAEGPDCTGP